MMGSEKSPTVLEMARSRTLGVREVAAEDLLSWTNVVRFIEDAANAGRDSATIRPRAPIDLRKTAAAAAAFALIRDQGFKVEWELMRDRPTDPEVPVVVVSW